MTPPFFSPLMMESFRQTFGVSMTPGGPGVNLIREVVSGKIGPPALKSEVRARIERRAESRKQSR
jgi:hypothetical protein